jgi:hypothetical protein
MKNYNLKFKVLNSLKTVLNYEKEVAKVNSKIYSQGESKDSPGGFGFKRTRKANK